MKIALTIPDFSRHGGIRMILEWANRLSEQHQVMLWCRWAPLLQPSGWFRLNPAVQISNTDTDLKDCGILIICSPHDIDLEHYQYAPKRKFLFLQMLEHMFRPTDLNWQKKCQQMYSSQLPLFAISQWNIRYIERMFPRRGEVYYVGNGVNFQDFPIDPQPANREPGTVLVEGWNAANPTKDVDRVGPRVAARLRNMGYRVIAYDRQPAGDYHEAVDEYYVRPDLVQLNELYSRASILIKATKYDARACAPLEAATKGCVTVRALIKGDDDLIHNINAWCTGYNAQELFDGCLTVLDNDVLRQSLADNALNYVQDYSWGHWMNRIQKVLGI